MDETYMDIADHSTEAQAQGGTNLLTFGADTTLRPGLITGFTLGGQNAHTTLYGDAMRITSDGYSLGPYFAWQYAQRWMFDASLNYTQLDNTQRILGIAGSYESRSFTASVGLTGNYAWGTTSVRPRVSLSYGKNWSDGFNLTGTLLGVPLDIVMPSDDYDTGTGMFSVEFSRIYYINAHTPILPFLNLEADWNFQRRGKGDPLTGDLSETNTSSWSGAVRTGVRMPLSAVTNITLGGGYTSIGQKGMDIWEWRFYLSHAF